MRGRPNLKTRLQMAVSAMTVIMAAPVVAQTEPPKLANAASSSTASDVAEVVVTAQHRTENLANVPISITAVGARELTEDNISDVAGLQRIVPGFSLTMGGANAQPIIRGVGTQVAGPGLPSNIAIYVDGYYQEQSVVNNVSFPDVQSVEVLKGPQGELYGQNATGGAVLVTTRDPEFKPTGDFDISYRSYNDVRGGLFVTGPMASNIAGSLSVYADRRDDYNVNLVGPDATPESTVDVHAKLLYTPTENLKFLLTGQFLHKSDANAFVENAYHGWATGALLGGVAASKPYEFSYDSPPVYTARVWDVGLKTTWELPFATLTSLSHEQWEKDLRGFDVDGTSLPIEVVHFPGTSNTASEELQLVSKSENRLQWLVGALYYYDHDTQAFNLLVPAVEPLFEGYVQTNSVAVYGDASYNIWNGLFLTAGARYSHDAVSEEFTPNGGPSTRANIDYQRVSPRAVLRYDFSKHSSVYASFSTGYKTGGYNPNGLSTTPVKPETINAYEVGYKQSGGAYHFEAAGFYYDYSNLQVNQYLGDITVLLNAARARIYGAELSGYFDPFSHLTIGGGISYTHARYASFPDAPEYVWEPQKSTCPFPPPGTPNSTGICIFPSNASGNPLAVAPDFTAKFDVTYRHELPYGGLRLNANVSYQTTIYFDPYKQTQQNPYALLNLRASWVSPDHKYVVSVFCDNCADKSYIDELFTQPIIFDQHWAPPRVVGVDLKVHL